MTRAAALALLLLAGCDNVPHAWSRSEIEDIASDSQPDIAHLEARIIALEAEVERLEGRRKTDAEFLVSFYNADKAEDENTSDNLDRLFGNDTLWRQHFTYLRAYHNLPPLPEPKN